MFNQIFIDTLKRDTSIVEFVQTYVSLKRKGSDFWACCPFHSESTPSFKVDNRGFFFCHGCLVKGDIYNFVEQIEGVTFPDAVKRVADYKGVIIVEDPGEIEKAKATQDLKRKVIKMNEIALELWQKNLQDNSTNKDKVFQYLESRGFDQRTVVEFQIGFTENSWSNLYDILKKDYTEDELLQSGLIRKNESGQFYDLFRNRAMFPIFDYSGLIIGFTGRVIDENENPKYLNSPETVLYTKSHHLYGLSICKDEIRKQGFAIITEGSMDKVAMSQFGIKNVVSNLGTNFSTEQAKLLKRWTDKVLVCFDGDAAGRKSAMKAINVLLEQEFTIKVMTIPDSLDPDEFLKQKGVDAFNDLRKKASGFLEYLFQQLQFTSLEEKIQAIDESLTFVKKIKNAMYRRACFDKIVGHYQVDKTLHADLWKSTTPENKDKIFTNIKAIKPTPAETILIELIINEPELMFMYSSEIQALNPSDLATQDLLRVLTNENLSPEVFANKLEDLRKIGRLDTDLVAILNGRNSFSNLTQQEKEYQMQSCIECLSEICYTNERNKLTERIREAEKNGDKATLNQLIEQSLAVVNSTLRFN